MITNIPKVLYKNKIAEVLDDMRYNYGKIARIGYIYGILAIDQDAKIIAIDSRFDRHLNYWDLSSCGDVYWSRTILIYSRVCIRRC